MDKWYKQFDEVKSFGLVLEACDEFEDTEAVHYFYNHPGKWNAEHEKWEELGNPVDEDDDNWDEFVDYLDER